MSALSPEEIVRRGKELYFFQIREHVDEAACRGQYLVLDVETGEYELDADHLSASDRAAAKHPNAALYAVRVGFATVGRLGGNVPNLRQPFNCRCH